MLHQKNPNIVKDVWGEERPCGVFLTPEATTDRTTMENLDSV